MISKPTTVDLDTDSTTVNTGVCYLYGVYVNTVVSEHNVPIKDGTTTIVTIPQDAAAGTHYSFPGIKFRTSLVVDPDNAASGSIVVAWSDREADAGL